MPGRESQTIEYRSSWQEDCFGWIAGYANAFGGTLYIGVNDDGYVVGVKDAKFLLDTLPNQIASYLGITVSIDHGTVYERGVNLKYGEDVPADMAMKPENLYARGFLTGQVVEDIIQFPDEVRDLTPAVQALFDAAPGFVKQLRKSEEYRLRVSDVKIDHEALEFLREHALEKNRLTQKAVDVSDDTLIRNLEVLTKAILDRIEELSEPKGAERHDRYTAYLSESLETLYFMANLNDLKIYHTGRLLFT